MTESHTAAARTDGAPDGTLAAAPELILDAVLNSATEYAIFTLDAQRRVTSWNIGGHNLLGWQAEEIVGGSGDGIFTPEDREAGIPEAEMRRALAEGRAADERWHVRKDGSRFWASGLLMPLTGAHAGQGFLKVLRDRTEAHRLRQLEVSYREVLAELQHRVRNTLSVIRSVVRRSAAAAGSVDDYAMHLDGRIGALSRLQGLVTRDPAASIDLEYLISEEFVTLAAVEGEQFELSGPPVRLLGGAALSMGLAIHELATNAMKFGALSTPEGRICVRWRAVDGADPPRLLVEWIETGVTLGPETARRSGFGTELLERTLPYETGASTTLRFAPGGVHCTMELPLGDRITLGDPHRQDGDTAEDGNS